MDHANNQNDAQPVTPQKSLSSWETNTSDHRIKPEGWLNQVLESKTLDRAQISMLVELDVMYKEDPILQPLMSELNEVVKIPGMPPITKVIFSPEKLDALLQSSSVLSIQPDPILKSRLSSRGQEDNL